MEMEQSGKSTEQQESRKFKEKKQKEKRSHTLVTNQDFVVCWKNLFYWEKFLGGEEWQNKDGSKCFILDDASTKKYINSDVTEQLKLKGVPKQVIANALNNPIKTFETLPSEFNFESLNVSGKSIEKMDGWKVYSDNPLERQQRWTTK